MAHFTQIVDSGGELNNLTDVVITTPALTEVLQYDGNDWVNGTIPITVALDDLTDVIITTPSNDDVLQYDGNDWVTTDVSDLLDSRFGSTAGSLLLRSEVGWSALGPGDTGDLVTMGATVPSWQPPRIVLTFDSTADTIAGVANVFPTITPLAITADDVYEFEACIKGWDTSHNLFFMVINNAKTQGYHWVWQQDGNLVLQNYDGSGHVLRASGSGSFSAIDIAVIRGTITFGSTKNTLTMENIGAVDLPVGDNRTLMAGTSIYFGVSCSANTFSNILKCSIRKMN
jgi:hypothetical protein